jgi:MFS family permease
MSGARRQIFVVFAAFMMVEKFHFDVADIALLYLANQVLNLFLAPLIGSWVGKVGERKALMLEYIGLICVFSAYAFVSSAAIAAFLYVIDHIFFSMAIAIKTYFQKIADREDMAATASVSFTINHIAAVVIPVLFGLLWLVSPTAVFLLGASMAAVSLCLSLLIPRHPKKGNEVGKVMFSAAKPAPEAL